MYLKDFTLRSLSLKAEKQMARRYVLSCSNAGSEPLWGGGPSADTSFKRIISSLSVLEDTKYSSRKWLQTSRQPLVNSGHVLG